MNEELAADKVIWSNSTFSAPEYYAYKPQPDITVYELAMILPLFCLAESRNGKYLWDYLGSLPPECMRHFEKSGG